MELTGLRPLWWIDASDATGGADVDIGMHEIGASGIARILAIDQCDVDSRDNSEGSNIVTGTIKHRNAEVWELQFSRTDKPLGVTANHPIYSQDRNTWIAAGELNIGEHVLTVDGTTALTGKKKRPGRHTVYNLEVHRSHAYHVSDLGILAHNSNILHCGTAINPKTRFLSDVEIKSHGRVVSRGTVDLKPTIDRINAGQRFPHRNDGSVFQNRPPRGSTTPVLPVQPRDYYQEYVIPTTGIRGPGSQRLVIGRNGDIWYTPDHYDSFIPVH